MTARTRAARKQGAFPAGVAQKSETGDRTALELETRARLSENRVAAVARKQGSQDPETVAAGVDPVTESGVSDGVDSYFGGKGSCFRHLVNQIPPHDWLFVPFAGHCAITRNMRLPANVLLMDKDGGVCDWWTRRLEMKSPNAEPMAIERRIEVLCGCGIKLLESLKSVPVDRAFIYLDPPYLLQTRKSGTRYQCEMSEADHSRMLFAANALDCRVMISGYESEMYSYALVGWRHYSFQAMTRGGVATEHVWCNYQEPSELQDYRWLGQNKRERFKLVRRERNLIDKLARLSPIERNALLSAVGSHFGDDGSR